MIDDAQARERRGALQAKLSERREKLARLGDALPEIERRAVEEEAAIHRRTVASAERELGHALQARNAAAKALTRSLRDVEQRVDEVVRHREIVCERVSTLRALLGEDADFLWPPAADEPWEIEGPTVAFLVQGPERPLAEAAAARDKRRREQDRADQELASWVRKSRQPSEIRRRLAEVLRDVDPESERHHRIKAACQEHLAKAEAEVARLRERERARKRERAAA